MSNKISTKDGMLQTKLLDEKIVEIESPVYKKVGIEVRILDPSVDVTQPKGAIYRIECYVPGINERGSGYDIAWVMSDGTILHRKDR